jgi:serine O-acetyltransferase
VSGEPLPTASVRGALVRMVDAVREDYASQGRLDERYGAGRAPGRAFVSDLVARAGLQLTVAYRVMRFFEEARVPLAPRVVSRLIRHVYGSDIHWQARIGPGLVVVHGMGLAINSAAVVGRGALLFQNVTLGASNSGAPTVGDDVHIGPGAVIVGAVTIGSHSKVMANCVVTASVPADSIVEAPSPTVRPRAGGARVTSLRPDGTGQWRTP